MKKIYIDDKVSVIIPVYNAAKYIEKTIDSVLAQTYKDYEIILVDDCSKDNSKEVIEKYVSNNDNIFYFCLSENSGAAVARNKGLELAKGRYVAFLDSDDIWECNKLEKQIAQMRNNGYAFSYSRYDYVDENKKTVKKRVYLKMNATYKTLLTKTVIATPTVMIDREQTGNVYMPLRRTGQDYAFWLLLLRRFDAYGLDDTLVHVCKRSNSLSKNKFQNIRDVWEVQTINEGLGKGRVAVNILRYCMYVFVKKVF